MSVGVAKVQLLRKVCRSAREGDGWPVEADDAVNNANRALVDAMQTQHGECWLGKINLYGVERHGGAAVLWKWDGDLVRNFSCAFVVPHYDAELETLIRARDDSPYTSVADDVPRVEAIMERIKEVGGHSLFWT